MSRSQHPPDSTRQHSASPTNGETAAPVPVTVYYMDFRNAPSDAPAPEDMYQYTPTIEDLIRAYAHAGVGEARSLTEVFHTWGDAPESRGPPETAWRSMNVGDIIIFDDTPYIVRPAGYDELSITIPE